MRVRYSLKASRDLAEIFSYIAGDNPKAASAVVGRVEEVVARLALFPGSGHLSDVPGVRIAPLIRFPYSVYYTVECGELLVLHVMARAAHPLSKNRHSLSSLKPHNGDVRLARMCVDSLRM